MTTVVLSSMWSAALLLLLLAVSHVRLQCDSGATFRAHCTGVSRRSFLLNESVETQTIECRNMDSENSYRWTRSPDGRQRSRADLDTSSNRYTINGRSLSIRLQNIPGEVGGLYGCEYGDSSITNELCIEVYERAVFESCPSEDDGCSESTQLSVTAGESKVFDASIVYTPGGSCDFQQMLDRVMLWRINTAFGMNNRLLFSCTITVGTECTINDSRVTLNRGDRPGLGFRFTLSDIQVNDSSSYQVIVLGRHPGTGTETRLTKNFDLQVDPAPTVPTPPAIESTTSLGTDNSVGAASGSDTGAVAAGVLVPLLVIALVVIVIGLLFLIVRWKQQGSLPSPSHPYKSSHVRKDPVKGDSNNGTTELPSRANSITVTTVSRTEVQPPLGDVRNILINIEESVVVSLPPENTRMSYVDSNMHDLPSKLQSQEVPDNLPLRAQSSPLESPGVHV